MKQMQDIKSAVQKSPRIFYFAGLAGLCMLWFIFSFAANSQFFASPAGTAVKFFDLIANGNLVYDLIVSLSRLFAGFLIAIVVGIPVGIFAGSSKKISAFFDPFLSLFRYIPAPALIPLSILWLGLGDSQKYFVVFFGTLPFVVLYVSNSVASIEREYFNAAYSLGASEFDVIIKVILPKIMPDIIDILRIELGASWALVIMAELVSATSGIGHRLILAQRFLHTDELFAILFLTLVIGLFVDKTLRFVHALMFPWTEKNMAVN